MIKEIIYPHIKKYMPQKVKLNLKNKKNHLSTLQKHENSHSEFKFI